MTGLGAFSLSILMIAAFLLAGRRPLSDRQAGATGRKGLLMLLAAAVMVGNVLIWTL